MSRIRYMLLREEVEEIINVIKSSPNPVLRDDEYEVIRKLELMLEVEDE